MTPTPTLMTTLAHSGNGDSGNCYGASDPLADSDTDVDVAPTMLTTTTTTLVSLPSELVIEILSYLDWRSLVGCERVCAMFLCRPCSILWLHSVSVLLRM
jgi:hypothetical protein